MREIYPFSAQGVYVYKLNPDKDLTNYVKPTRLQKMWNTAISPDEVTHFYSFIWFFPNYDFVNRDIVITSYSIVHRTMQGEVFDLIHNISNPPPHDKIDNLSIIGNEVFFTTNSIDLLGVLNEGILTLYFKTDNENNVQQYRFIPTNKSKL